MGIRLVIIRESTVAVIVNYKLAAVANPFRLASQKKSVR